LSSSSSSLSSFGYVGGVPICTYIVVVTLLRCTHTTPLESGEKLIAARGLVETAMVGVSVATPHVFLERARSCFFFLDTNKSIDLSMGRARMKEGQDEREDTTTWAPKRPRTTLPKPMMIDVSCLVPRTHARTQASNLLFSTYHILYTVLGRCQGGTISRFRLAPGSSH
jgi:hypothetical protein